MSRRFPDALIQGEVSFSGLEHTTAAEWLQLKSAQVLGRLGRHREAAEIGETFGWGSAGHQIGNREQMAHHMLTGELWEPKWLQAWDIWNDGRPALQRERDRCDPDAPSPDGARVESFMAALASDCSSTPSRIRRSRTISCLSPRATYSRNCWSTPSLRTGIKGYIEFIVSKDEFGDAGVKTKTIARALKEGVRLAGVPRTGRLYLRGVATGDAGGMDPSLDLLGVRVVAQLEKIDDHGANRGHVAPTPSPSASDVDCRPADARGRG